MLRRVALAALSASTITACVSGGGGGSGDTGSAVSVQNVTSSTGTNGGGTSNGSSLTSPSLNAANPNTPANSLSSGTTPAPSTSNASGTSTPSNPGPNPGPSTPGATVSGLDFPGSAAAGGTMRFHFSNPLPAYPATYIWRVYIRQQNGYYTTFFWGNNGSFLWDRGSPDTYYGAHPYPEAPPNGSTHRWEIAVGGGDVVSPQQVTYDAWTTQALRVWSDSSGKHHEFYWDLNDPAKVVRDTQPTSYGENYPPNPVLVFGDAPWNEGNEVLNGVLRGIQIYSGLLSLADIGAEVTSPLSTTQGSSSIWYLNLNPTPTDIADKSGRGNHPGWVNARRPGLWVAQ